MIAHFNRNNRMADEQRITYALAHGTTIDIAGVHIGICSARPGGVLAIQDYCRATLRRIPEPPHWENFLAADLAFFASQGGNANIGARLPGLYERAGLELVDVVGRKPARAGT